MDSPPLAQHGVRAGAESIELDRTVVPLTDTLRYRRNVRCYLIAEHPTDLSSVREVLSDLGVEVVEPAQAFDAATLPRRGWLPTVDMVCAIFPADHGWETPASLYLELGEAVGAGIPVLLFVEPPRRLDAALFSLPVARIPTNNRVALASQFSLFLQSVGKSSELAIPPRRTDSFDLKLISRELAELRQDFEISGFGEAIQSTARRLEDLALRLFKASGAEVVATSDDEGIGDMAAWVPGTERFIPGPLLVEVKILRKGPVARETLEKLQLYALTRDAPWSLLLYYRWKPAGRISNPKGGAWPNVIVLDIEELTRRLRHEPLATVLNNERNAIIHGLDR
ncbi:hypothetical protein [Actinoplanes sp. NPDC026623]|uniref:hypothetical protein n=1 Tax=Actinoplanes sp. NPDC026623 TaxID=3155610 RepID=UPI003405393D